MEEWPKLVSLLGLVFDLVGFFLIARELLKSPDKRLFGGGGELEGRIDRTGFLLVIGGFFLQVVGVSGQIDWASVWLALA